VQYTYAIIRIVLEPFDVTKLYRVIGRQIAEARDRFRPETLSQSDLAERVGLARGSIANIERGRQHPPIETLYRIADALGVEPRQLLPSIEDLRTADSATPDISTLPEPLQEKIRTLGITDGELIQYLSDAQDRLSKTPRGTQ